MNNENYRESKTKTRKSNAKPNARVDIAELCECVVGFVLLLLLFLLLLLLLSLSCHKVYFQHFPCNGMRNSSNFCGCLMAWAPGLAWDTPLHVKDKRVFNYSSCYFHNSYPQQSLTNFSVPAGWLPAFLPIQQSCNSSIRQCFNAAESLPFRSVQWRIKIRLPVGSSARPVGAAQ